MNLEQRAKSIQSAVECDYATWLKTGDLPEDVVVNEYQFTLSRSGLGIRSRNANVMRAIAEANVPRGWDYNVLETVSGDPVFVLGQYRA